MKRLFRTIGDDTEINSNPLMLQIYRDRPRPDLHDIQSLQGYPNLIRGIHGAISREVDDVMPGDLSSAEAAGSRIAAPCDALEIK